MSMQSAQGDLITLIIITIKKYYILDACDHLVMSLNRQISCPQLKF